MLYYARPPNRICSTIKFAFLYLIQGHEDKHKVKNIQHAKWTNLSFVILLRVRYVLVVNYDQIINLVKWQGLAAVGDATVLMEMRLLTRIHK